MRLLALVLFMQLCSCATVAPEPRGRAWNPTGYAGFVESIEALVGPTAIDCGFFNLLDGKPASKVRRKVRACVQQAIATGQIFKYGTVRVPMDSYATEVIARTADGKLWKIAYDIMIDGEAPQQWNQICQTVAVDRRTMIIISQGCVEESTGRLVAK